MALELNFSKENHICLFCSQKDVDTYIYHAGLLLEWKMSNYLTRRCCLDSVVSVLFSSFKLLIFVFVHVNTVFIYICSLLQCKTEVNKYILKYSIAPFCLI